MVTDKTCIQSDGDSSRLAADRRVQELLDRALQHHRAGRLDEASSDYRRILEIQSGHGDALHMLGVIAYQKGDNDKSIALIRRAAMRLPPNAGVHVNLGNALQAHGSLEDAVAEYRAAIELEPEHAVACNNIGNALRMLGQLDAAVSAFRKALSIDGGYVDAHVNLATTLQAQDDVTGAINSYERAVLLDPGHESAAHMLAALRGELTDAAPGEHIASLFDGYAARFDHHLVDTLGYSMPGLLRAEIDRLLGRKNIFPEVIDLGCGTGLAGLAFRPVSGRLTGVDLSQRMIDRARGRGVYDELLVSDLVPVLDASDRDFDLFVCADVFPYMGNVEPLFAAIRRCAGTGALFAFSTELNDAEGYILRPSGRYAHAQSYLREVAAASGFTVMTMRTEKLRKQKEEWILGDLIVLQYDYE